LRLIVVDDRHMRALNRRYRHKDKPTDVLSFPEGEPFPGEGRNGRIGEVYCNYQHAWRWAREEGGTVASELTRLAVHGTLHLLGYDHHTPVERKVMAEREARYLADTGLIAARGAKPRHVD
jgi:probable rRNA maturation factor